MITKEEIENLASLSKLYVSEKDIPVITKDLMQMITFVQGVNKAVDDKDTDNVTIAEGNAVLREDVAGDSVCREAAVVNAPMSGDGYFVVRKSE